jgi:hypothetical protein
MSLIVTTWAMLTANGGRLLDLSGWNFPWHDYLIGALGHLTLFGTGYLFSLLRPASEPVNHKLTLAGWFGVQGIDKATATNRASTVLQFREPGKGSLGSSRPD